MNLLRRRKLNVTPAASEISTSTKEAPGGHSHAHKTKAREEKKVAHTTDEDRTSMASSPDAKPSTSVSSSTFKIRKGKSSGGWRCLDTCCWLVGYICVTWWLLLVLYNAMPFLPHYVTEAITGPLPDPPGMMLKRAGVRAKHPVVFVPGIVTGGLELWEGHPCAEGLFRKRLWGGTFGEVYKRPLCWVEHMSLNNVTGLDPPGVRVRPVSGLVAADYFAAGYFVWAVLIDNLARIGYEEKSMHMAVYDWRLSFQNTEVRDKSLSRLKSTIELMVQTNDGNKIVAMPHSMGVLYFLHFMKWVEAPLPMGGGGGPDWCAKHIKALISIGGTFLGVPKALSSVFSSESKDIAVARTMAAGVMDSELLGFQTIHHVMRMVRSWDASIAMMPKGGEVIWGGLDWAPEEDFDCGLKKHRAQENELYVQERNASTLRELGSHGKSKSYYGRMISFGKDAAETARSNLEIKDLKEACHGAPTRNNVSCEDLWTEYHELSSECVQAIAANKAYTLGTIPELLRLVAPKMMERMDAQFSHGLADNLDDPKYQHYKYWSNPLETTLPNAPDMEIYCMYGVGLPTERGYIYKVSPQTDSCYIPFRIDLSVQGGSESCLKGGVQFVNGDESVPVISSGFMCAKGWRGKTRFNPSGVSTFIREYEHSPPSNLLEGRGIYSASHVDILGNFALIEDVLNVVAGATGEDIGGDRVYSDILKWSERISLKL